MNDQHKATDMTGECQERWVYAGLRIVRARPLQAWITESGDGDLLYFTPKGRPVIGEIYRVYRATEMPSRSTASLPTKGTDV